MRLLSITDDYSTIEERKLIKEWTDKAKAQNAEERKDSKCIDKIRGTPKNGLSLVRFTKRKN